MYKNIKAAAQYILNIIRHCADQPISAATLKYYLFFSTLIGSITTSAQRVVDVDKSDANPNRGNFFTVAGNPISLIKYIRVVEGSPFFSESWMTGSILLTDGRLCNNISLKLDLLSNEIYFLGVSGKELIATVPVAELILRDSINGTEYFFVNAAAFVAAPAPEAGWFLLLCEGNVSLFKKFQKNIRETRPYGAATFEQTILTTSAYYLLFNNTFYPVKKFSMLPEILSNKNLALGQFMKKNGLSGKTDEDYVALVQYYNSIVQDK